MHDILKAIQFSKKYPEDDYVFASLVRSSGSSYRKLGARMLIHRNGDFSGCISGGCLESELVLASREVFKEQKGRLLNFDTRQFFGCHGNIDIFLEYVSSESTLFSSLDQRLEARENVSLVTCFDENSDACGSRIGSAENSEYVFKQLVEPGIRLWVVGSGLDVPPLFDLADSLGWETLHLVEPFDLQRTRPYLHESSLNLATPDELFTTLTPDAKTAIVLITHQYARDLHYLKEVLGKPFGYIGLLGSKRRQNEIFGTLADEGYIKPEISLENFHGPVGLNIPADTPETIALSIVGEIQSCL